MQIGFNSSIQNINKVFKIDGKKSNPIAFCGNDEFEPSPELKAENEAKDITRLLISTKNPYLKPIVSFVTPDSASIELEELAENYSFSKTKQNKVKLLEHEENMLWQELDKPYLGVKRNLFELVQAGRTEDDIIPAVKIAALNGIIRTHNAYDSMDVRTAKDNHKLEILKKVVKNTSDDEPYAKDIKETAIYAASFVYAGRSNISEFLEYVIDNTNFESVKNTASRSLMGSQFNEDKAISMLTDDSSSLMKKRTSLINLATLQSKKLTGLLPSMIKDDNLPQPLKITSVWAAGRCQSEDSFKLLHQIANNKSEKDLELREMALHSFALYLRKNEGEVKHTLKSVVAEKSDLSELAQILLEKTEGRYNQKDRELNNFNLSDESKTEYKEFRDKYVQSQKKMNIKNTNIIDRALSPFREALKNITNGGSKAHFLNDTATNVFTDEAGKRIFDEDALYGGQFYDATTGVNSYEPSTNNSTIVIMEKYLNSELKENVLAHEFNHNFEYELTKQDAIELKMLYENAVNGNKCLDDYAALNESEYFAQGYEAYTSVYKPHSSMIYNDDFQMGSGSHVRSSLKRKDPDLYNFIEHCIDKYGKNVVF